MPDRYYEDCVQIAGRLLDHDDTPARMPAVMEINEDRGEETRSSEAS